MINTHGSTTLIKLENLIEEVYGYPVWEFPSKDFRDMGNFVDAKNHGYSNRNWLRFKPRRDKQGFSLADDLLIILLLCVEKQFDIIIKDEVAEKINTTSDLQIGLSKLIQQNI